LEHLLYQKEIKTVQASRQKQAKTMQTCCLGTRALKKTAKNDTSFQYEKKGSDKNHQRQYKRVAWEHML
jgi:hypothetical protein